MQGFIYLILNFANGKAYVGQTNSSVQQRFDRHKSDARAGSLLPLHCAMRKYGIEKFSILTILTTHQSLLNNLERHYIQVFKTHVRLGFGYNVTLGGEGSFGYIPSAKTLIKLSISHKGKKISAETKLKMSQTRKGRKQPWVSLTGKKRKGIPLSQEHKNKIGNANRGRKLGARPDHVRAKIKAAHLAKRGSR